MLTYIIGIPGNSISEGYMKLSVPQIERCLGVKPDLWVATVPETLPEGPLQFSIIRPTDGTPWSREFSPERKAIWYSHFLLWKHVAESGQNAWIFEHDVNLEEAPVLLSRDDKDFTFVRGIGSLESYYITNWAAKQLVKRALEQPLRDLTDTFVKMMVLTLYQNRYYTMRLPVTQYLHLGVTSNDIHDARFRKNDESLPC